MVNQVSQSMHGLVDIQMIVIKKISRYLKGIIGYGLVYYRSRNETAGQKLITYTNVGWVGDPVEKRFISSLYTFIGKNLVTWSSRKQNQLQGQVWSG